VDQAARAEAAAAEAEARRAARLSPVPVPVGRAIFQRLLVALAITRGTLKGFLEEAIEDLTSNPPTSARPVPVGMAETLPLPMRADKLAAVWEIAQALSAEARAQATEENLADGSFIIHCNVTAGDLFHQAIEARGNRLIAAVRAQDPTAFDLVSNHHCNLRDHAAEGYRVDHFQAALVGGEDVERYNGIFAGIEGGPSLPTHPDKFQPMRATTPWQAEERAAQERRDQTVADRERVRELLAG
jgi:hypothetical protein